MRYSMICQREVTVVRTSDVQVTIVGLMRELNEIEFDATQYDGILADVAFELDVEHTFLAQIADNFMGGEPVGYGSRMLLEEDQLDGTMWRLSEGTLVDLSLEPSLFTMARVIQRVRRACRMNMASGSTGVRVS